jgi:hypothetical protein
VRRDLRRDGAHALALLEDRRDIGRNDAKERADGGEPDVAGGDAALPLDLKVLEEGEHRRRIEVDECEVGDLLAGAVRCEAEQQLERVAVAVDRVRARAALAHEVVGEEEGDLAAQGLRRVHGLLRRP